VTVEALPGTKTLGLPPAADLGDEKVRRVLAGKIANQLEPEYAFSHIDPAQRVAVYTLRQAVSVLTSTEAGDVVVEVSTTTSMANLAALEAQFKRVLESDEDKYPRPPDTHWYLSGADAPNHQLTFTPLTDRERYVRDSLATDVFKCKPWQVRVRENPDKTITVVLPQDYVPSKHDKVLADIVESKIGQPGWWCDADPKTYRAVIHPGALPTFKPSYHPPVLAPRRFAKVSDQMSVEVGIRLGGRGKPNSPLILDFNTSPHLLCSGQTRGGKSAWVNHLLYATCGRGWELVVCNTVDKMADVAWVAPFCRPGGFGVSSKEHAMAALGLLYEEVQNRTREFPERGAKKWQELSPADRERFPLILSFIDEVPQLLTPMMAKSTAKELDEDDPRRQDAMSDFVSTALVNFYLGKLVKVAAAFGVCVIMSSQGATQNDGVPKTLRTNLGNRILCGSNPDKGVFEYAFRGKNLPEVPDWIKNDPDTNVSKGSGVAEFDGQEPCVFKGFYEEDSWYASSLKASGAPTTTLYEPTADQIARFAASSSTVSDKDLTDADWNQTRSPISGESLSSIAARMGDDWDVDPETGDRVTGFAKANLGRHVAATNGQGQ